MAGLEASLMEQGLDWISRELVGDNTTSEAALAGQDPGPGEEDPFFRDSFFHPDLIPDSEPCKEILHFQVGASTIRLWDLLLLLPNLAFLLFLFYRLPWARARLGASPSHLHRCLHHLVLASSLAGALRCLLAMLLQLASPHHHTADTVVWLAARLVLLTAELAVAALAGAFGLVEEREVVRRVVVGSGVVAVLVCGVQGGLELAAPYYGLQLSSGLQLYGGGGPACLAATSALLALLHLLLLASMLRPTALLPAPLPPTAGLALYCAAQLALHTLAAAGAALLASHSHAGLCLTTVTSFASSTLLPPLIYACLLVSWRAPAQPSLLFQYKAQLDDTEEVATLSVRQEESATSRQEEETI